MPITPPPLDDRRFTQLVDSTLARARVHTPEWTNFNQSDPGVTLVQLFAFLTENLLYRANLVPQRNRARFLQMLRLPLASASAANGLVAIANDRGEATVQTLPADLEVRAGAVPFRTQLGLEVLPLEARVFFKRPLAAASQSPDLMAYYRLLYASYQMPFPDDVQLYETVALDPQVVDSVDLNADTIDAGLWIALLARRTDVPDVGPDPWKTLRDRLGGRTLTLGLVPALEATSASLTPTGQAQPGQMLRFELPEVKADGRVARDANDRPAPSYRQLEARTEVDLLSVPGVVQLTLPGAAQLRPWQDVDPLEGGVGDMPPTLDDPTLGSRLVTWLRVRVNGAAQARIRWTGINAAPIRQIQRVAAEPLADGDGTPDQSRRLARAPVLPGSVTVITRAGDEPPLTWSEIDDLAAAGPEVPVGNPRSTAREWQADDSGRTDVFELDAEAGELRFGDGLRGRRLPLGARVLAAYAFCQGAAGNVAEGAIDSAPQLPSGFTVTNPVQTWGGADAEDVATGEKQVRRYLQHRDRLVSADDFEAITLRAPGVQIGRVEILPAFHPDLVPNEPGAAPGVVTVMAIPKLDPGQPDAPRADRLFLNALCQHLDPRRLVTTELVVRGPVYKGLWISVGVETAAGFAIAEVVDAVKARLRAWLAPVGPNGDQPRETPLFSARSVDPARGWPLRTPVASRVMLAEVARVAGVLSVADVLIAEGSRAAADVIGMTGLELPRVLGISVVSGDPLPLDALRGGSTGSATPTTVSLLPVPVVPETC
ncbi:baseplate J/gp47 family protein [Roseateles amylovorans]|uniref:Baseplate J/gp47 family protein n=1 Tax=Roseateles amylovorans TaxID=2978473 RepID=A0ABY6B196_9BURK|nr:baseplate J/gp47 family protein [Roseateles amylovorans]UXH79167.1 baseplate J/gp47 family protein [Roseateles amylovorans]